MPSEKEGEGISAANRGSWSAFLKSIASFSGDLSSLTAPPFILSSTSLVEFSSYWAEHPSIFVAPAHEEDPQKRALLVLKWFLSTLKQQYASRSEKFGNEKKPLNPFLGELFLGKWVDAAGTTELVSEQVSHHPPATAYNISNKQHGVSLQGYNAQKASFSRTINVRQIGHAIYKIDAYDETYLITLPNLHIEGLIFGSPFVELNDTTYITSSSGYTAKIDYSGKGWLSGKKNSFTAALYPTGKEKDTLYTISGQWTKTFEIREGCGKTVLETYDAEDSPTTPLTIAPIEEQDDLESRKAWLKVAAGIAVGDMDIVGVEKTKIEVSQRELRNKEKAEGRIWERRYFSLVEDDPILNELGPLVGCTAEADKTGGIWRVAVSSSIIFEEMAELKSEYSFFGGVRGKYLTSLASRLQLHARNSTFTPVLSSPHTTYDQSSIPNSDIGAFTALNPTYEMQAPTRPECTSWASKAKPKQWMKTIVPPKDPMPYNWDSENFTATSIQVSNSPRIKVSNRLAQPMSPILNIRNDTTQSSVEEIPLDLGINARDDTIQSSLNEFPNRKLKIRNEKMEAIHTLEEEFSTEDEGDLHHTLRKLSRAFTPPKSDVDPEERIAAERSLFELQENKSEKGSIRTETPPPTNKLSLPTPKVTGAFIETPAPIHALRPSTPEYSSNTEEDFDQTPLQNKFIPGNKPSRGSLPLERPQPPVNTAPSLSVSEDLKTIKKEALIEDSTIEREFDAVLEADAAITNDIYTHSRKQELESETLERMDRSLRHTSTSIRAARQGIERLEERVSRSVTIRSTTTDSSL
ncbi:Fructose-bisphosphate aldolase [Chlorociboria aeruginascens]|nr:Fructose-bisphosphate aldolase [Chlorociboria aeruginascens]